MNEQIGQKRTHESREIFFFQWTFQLWGKIYGKEQKIGTCSGAQIAVISDFERMDFRFSSSLPVKSERRVVTALQEGSRQQTG